MAKRIKHTQAQISVRNQRADNNEIFHHICDIISNWKNGPIKNALGQKAYKTIGPNLCLLLLKCKRYKKIYRFILWIHMKFNCRTLLVQRKIPNNVWNKYSNLMTKKVKRSQKCMLIECCKFNLILILLAQLCCISSKDSFVIIG